MEAGGNGEEGEEGEQKSIGKIWKDMVEMGRGKGEGDKWKRR